ncbi:MAG: CDP-diacylglycerol--glycerol-3-phosphate 3-phosphatidyltransferase [Chitinivibrionales bacterium]|nr:CDP-diacylglycerol--glycerol-3-phosphate 3-phosphatidyltransferase [Chitinivibrionales bacterium]
MIIPQMLTLSRIIFAPVFSYLFIYSFKSENPALLLWLSVAMLTLVEISDALDGFFARKLKQVSDFGKLFDPMADSLSRLTVFLGFLVAGIIPLWMFLIFLYRDIFVSGLRMRCLMKGMVVSARVSGKLKAIIQAIAGFGVTGLHLVDYYQPGMVPETITGNPPGYYFVLVAAIFTAGSFLDYYYGNRHVWGDKDEHTSA